MNPISSAVLILCVMILLNAFFSLSEMAVVSSKKSRLKVQAEKGKRSASWVLSLTENPTAFLSTIQIGITLIGILAGAYGESRLSGELVALFERIPLVTEYADTAATATVVIIVTFASILAGELIPKRLALTAPERIASVIVYPMRAITVLFLPLVRVLSFLTDGFVWLTGIRGGSEPPVSREEIRMIMREGEQHGLFHREQSEIAEAALDLHTYRLPLIMTPRPDILYLDMNDTAAKIRQKIIEYCEVAHLPVCRGGLDSITGVIKTRDLMKVFLTGKYKKLDSHMKEPLFVPHSMSPARLLEVFRATGNRVAFIVDEYGGIIGLVSMTDILDEIVGEIMPSYSQRNDKSILDRPDGSYLADGAVPIRDFTDHLGIEMTISDDYNTLAGLVMNLMGHIPAKGEQVAWNGMILKVVEIDGNRIERVLVKKNI